MGTGRSSAKWRATPLHRGGSVAVFPAAARSHSLSRGYRAFLPTSLGRVRPSPEVVRLGDLLRFSVRSLFCARTASGRRQPGACAPYRAGSRAEPFPGAVAGHPGTTSGRAGRRRGCCAGVASSQAAGMLAGVPFGACGALAVRLGPGHPGAVAGALETFSTSVVRHALSLLQPRSGPARGPGGLRATVRAARRHALPGGSQRRVGRGLQRDPFSGRADSAGEL